MCETFDFIVQPTGYLLGLQGRRSRSRMLASRLARTVRMLAASTGVAVDAIATALLRRHVRHALHHLDDRMLADIGLNRSDIDAIARGEIPPRARRDFNPPDHGWRQTA